MHCNVSLSKWQEAVFKLKVCGFDLPNTQSSHVKLCKPSKPTKTTNASASQQWDSSYHLWNICRFLPIIQVQMGIRRLEIYLNGQRVYICIFVYLEERDGANVRQKVRARLNRVVLWRVAAGRRRSGWQNRSLASGNTAGGRLSFGHRHTICSGQSNMWGCHHKLGGKCCPVGEQSWDLMSSGALKNASLATECYWFC